MDINEFDWDDDNESKIEQRLGVRSVESLLATDVLLLRNKGQTGRPQRYKVVGRDYSGQWITVVVQPVDRASAIWRPVTGWESTMAERSAARRAGLR